MLKRSLGQAIATRNSMNTVQDCGAAANCAPGLRQFNRNAFMDAKAIKALLAVSTLCGVFAGPAAADEGEEAFTDCLHNRMQMLPVKDCQAVLLALANLRYRYKHGADVVIPQVVVHLHSGKDFMGFVLDAVRSDQGKMLLLQVVEEGDRFPMPKAAYINMNDVDAVTIQSASDAFDVLSFGETTIPPVTAPPTRLDIKRQQARLSAILTDVLGTPVNFEVDWAEIAETGEPLRQLNYVMNDTIVALTSLADDQFTRKEFAKKLRTVKFVKAPQAAIQFHAGTLVVSSSLNSRARQEINASPLKAAIQKVM